MQSVVLGRLPCGRTCLRRDRGATHPIGRARHLREGAVAGRISCSPHPHRSASVLPPQRRNACQSSSVNSSQSHQSTAQKMRLLCRDKSVLCAVTLHVVGPFGVGGEAELAAIEPHPVHDHRQFAATATTARLCPRLAATRTSPSPALEMWPSRSTDVPDCSRRGVNPKCAPTSFDLRKRTGSSIAALNVSAATGPTP